MAGGAPPPEAFRAKGVSAPVTAVVAVVMLLAGLGIGYVAFRSPGGAPKKTTLVVGTNVPFPPFENFNYTTGEFEGFDIDISALIATQLNRTLVVRQFASFPTLLLTVGNGGVDMAASSITMSGAVGAQRNATMSFSDPYYNANQGVLVKSGSTLACASTNGT